MTDQTCLTKLAQAGYTVPESDRLEWVLGILQRPDFRLHFEHVDFNTLWYAEIANGVASGIGSTPLSAALRLACALIDAGVLPRKDSV